MPSTDDEACLLIATRDSNKERREKFTFVGSTVLFYLRTAIAEFFVVR